MSQKKENSPMKRNLLFWGREAERIMAMCVLFAFGFGLYMWIIDKGVEITVIPRYMLVMGIFMSILVPMTHIPTNVALTISMGARRKETLWGIEIMNILLSLQILLVYMVTNVIFNKDFNARKCLLALILLIGTAAIGQIASTISLRAGRTGMVLACLMILAIVLLVILYLLLVEGSPETFFEKLSIAKIVGGLVIAAAIYVISAFVMKRQLKNYAVSR